MPSSRTRLTLICIPYKPSWCGDKHRRNLPNTYLEVLYVTVRSGMSKVISSKTQISHRHLSPATNLLTAACVTSIALLLLRLECENERFLQMSIFEVGVVKPLPFYAVHQSLKLALGVPPASFAFTILPKSNIVSDKNVPGNIRPNCLQKVVNLQFKK